MFKKKKKPTLTFFSFNKTNYGLFVGLSTGKFILYILISLFTVIYQTEFSLVQGYNNGALSENQVSK